MGSRDRRRFAEGSESVPSRVRQYVPVLTPWPIPLYLLRLVPWSPKWDDEIAGNDIEVSPSKSSPQPWNENRIVDGHAG